MNYETSHCVYKYIYIIHINMHAWPPSDPFMQLYWHSWYLIWCHPCYPTRRIHNTNTRRKMRKYIYLHMLYFILCKLYVYLEIHTYRQLFGKTDTSTGICCPVYACRISHTSYIHHTYITLHYMNNINITYMYMFMFMLHFTCCILHMLHILHIAYNTYYYIRLHIWMVVWNSFPYILGIIVPTD